MNHLDAIGARFKAARERAEMTQAQVAEMVGISRVSVTNFELGRQDAPISRVLAMCAAVGATVAEVTGESPPVIPLEQVGVLRTQIEHLAVRCAALQREGADLHRENGRLAAIVDRQTAQLRADR